MFERSKPLSHAATSGNYFYNVPTEEYTTRKTLLGDNNEMIWLIVLGFLLFYCNDLNTCSHGESKNNLLLVGLLILLFTKTAC